MADIPHVYIPDRATWRAWLQAHHDSEQAVWLVYDKAAPGMPRRLTWADIVQEALCFGWIDSRPGKVSATQSKLYVSRRGPRSAWSKINKGYVETLERDGLMTAAGRQAIDRAKRNGSWDTLNRSDNLEIPADLLQRLRDFPPAAAHFTAFSASARRLILEWIYSAKRPETRERRVRETAELAAKNIKAHVYLRKDNA